MKRLLTSVFLCIIAISASLPQEFVLDNINYRITSSAEPLTVEVTSKIPYYEGDIVIPSTIEFNGNTYGVTSIGKGAFTGCTGLTSLIVGNSVITIGDWAFEGCTGLTSIEIPSSVTSIGKGAFSKCTELTSVVIGNSVTTIGEEAFALCTGLTSIEIPSSLTSIGDYAFASCTELTSIEVASDNDFYASIDGVLYNKDITTLISCPAGKTSVSMPSSITSIGNGGFAFCTGITSIIIPNSVTSVGDYAFALCTGLTYIECHAISPPSLGEEVFVDVPMTIPLYVPEESIGAYQAAAQWKDFIDIRPLTTLSTESINFVELIVYPNPVQNMLSIKGVEENAMVKIYDLKGHLIFSSGNIQENQSIDVSFLPSGVYVVKVVQDGRSSFARVVKE